MLDMLNYEQYLTDILVKNYKDVCICCQNVKDKPYAIVPEDYKFNQDYTLKQCLDIIYSSHAGGALVLFPKDIAFTWITRKSILKDVMLDVLAYLRIFNPNIVMIDNDIMLNGKKILGCMTKCADIYYEGLFFSFDSDIAIIKNVCCKEMKKVPLGLTAINVTPESIKELIDKLVDKYHLKKYGGDN